MKRNPSKQSTKILSILIFSMGVMLSGNNVFAADSTPNRVTQAEFNAAIVNQATVDAGQQTTIDAQQTALNQALDDIAKLQAAIDKLTAPKIGDFFGGGIIFYVDATGQHGLIAALSDQNFHNQWYNGVYKVTGATGDGVGAGATNTAIIVAAQSNDTPGGNFAAKVASDYSVKEDGLTACTGSVDEICYGDWYLPAKHELNLLYQQKDVVSGFADDFYWSSTEYNDTDAYIHLFSDGQQLSTGKFNSRRVRPIRVF